MVSGNCIKVISVKDIIRDDSFKISKNLKNTELAASIKISGMLEKPFLIKQNNYYYPFTCHNRISIILESDITEIESFILEKPSYEIFIRNLLLKIYRNECGPIGRIKAFKILLNEFEIDRIKLNDFARKTFKIPKDIFSDEKILNRIIDMPEILKNYIDSKDIPFKVIRDIVLFDDDTMHMLCRWIEKIQIRLNIFKMLVDFIFDIRKRDGEFKDIDDDVLLKMDDKALYDYVFKIRYPEFAEKKLKADKIINHITGNGVSVDFPEFFEKDTVLVKLAIKKKDAGVKLEELVSGIDVKNIDELLSLL